MELEGTHLKVTLEVEIVEFIFGLVKEMVPEDSEELPPLFIDNKLPNESYR